MHSKKFWHIHGVSTREVIQIGISVVSVKSFAFFAYLAESQCYLSQVGNMINLILSLQCDREAGLISFLLLQTSISSYLLFYSPIFSQGKKKSGKKSP